MMRSLGGLVGSGLPDWLAALNDEVILALEPRSRQCFVFIQEIGPAYQ
jgi:hypothetical protein